MSLFTQTRKSCIFLCRTKFRQHRRLSESSWSSPGFPQWMTPCFWKVCSSVPNVISVTLLGLNISLYLSLQSCLLEWVVHKGYFSLYSIWRLYFLSEIISSHSWKRETAVTLQHLSPYHHTRKVHCSAQAAIKWYPGASCSPNTHLCVSCSWLMQEHSGCVSNLCSFFDWPDFQQQSTQPHACLVISVMNFFPLYFNIFVISQA